MNSSDGAEKVEIYGRQNVGILRFRPTTLLRHFAALLCRTHKYQIRTAVGYLISTCHGRAKKICWSVSDKKNNLANGIRSTIGAIAITSS